MIRRPRGLPRHRTTCYALTDGRRTITCNQSDRVCAAARKATR
jgi:hypothetical protein